MLIAVPGEVKNAVDGQPGQKSEVKGEDLSPLAPPRRGRREAPIPSSPGVVLKDILDALTVVDIPVNNENPGDRQCRAHRGAGPPALGPGAQPRVGKG